MFHVLSTRLPVCISLIICLHFSARVFADRPPRTGEKNEKPILLSWGAHIFSFEKVRSPSIRHVFWTTEKGRGTMEIRPSSIAIGGINSWCPGQQFRLEQLIRSVCTVQQNRMIQWMPLLAGWLGVQNLLLVLAVCSAACLGCLLCSSPDPLPRWLAAYAFIGCLLVHRLEGSNRWKGNEDIFRWSAVAIQCKANPRPWMEQAGLLHPRRLLQTAICCCCYSDPNLYTYFIHYADAYTYTHSVQHLSVRNHWYSLMCISHLLGLTNHFF